MKLCLRCHHPFDQPEWNCPACGWGPAEAASLPVFAPELQANNDGWNIKHFQELAVLEGRSFWFRARNRLICWLVRRYFPAARRALEVGCGTGYVLSGLAAAFPGLRLTGTDGTLEGLEFARARCPGATLLQSDARSIPFQDEFDVVGAYDVLEHIEDDETAIHQIYRAIRPGGGVIVTVPQHRFLWSSLDEAGFHKRRYARRELLDKLEKAGFEIERAGSFVFLPLPLMLLSRLRLAREVEKLDPAGELRLGTLPNFILEKTLDLEIAMIRVGLTPPAGGSLFAVARKRRGRG